MASPKTQLFDAQTTRLAELAKALSHPARLAILQKIAEHKTCICGEIVEALPLAQATVSQHLKTLKDVGLLCGEIDGSRSCYCLNYKVLGELQEHINSFFTEVETSRQQCC